MYQVNPGWSRVRELHFLMPNLRLLIRLLIRCMWRLQCFLTSIIDQRKRMYTPPFMNHLFVLTERISEERTSLNEPLFLDFHFETKGLVQFIENSPLSVCHLKVQGGQDLRRWQRDHLMYRRGMPFELA